MMLHVELFTPLTTTKEHEGQMDTPIAEMEDALSTIHKSGQRLWSASDVMFDSGKVHGGSEFVRASEPIGQLIEAPRICGKVL